MGKLIDLTGQKFGYIAITDRGFNNKWGEATWNGICACGSFINVVAGDLKSGHTKSCGCLNKEKVIERNTTHGMAYNPLYYIWYEMINRCYNTNHKSYKYYGAKGIKVCQRWLDSLENFIEDMGERPESYTVERVNRKGDYCKENCIWATRKVQQNNTSRNVWLEFKEEKKTIAQWAYFYGIPYNTLWQRLKVGWSIEKALTIKVKG
jgi:hypothetical protein